MTKAELNEARDALAGMWSVEENNYWLEKCLREIERLQALLEKYGIEYD